MSIEGNIYVTARIGCYKCPTCSEVRGTLEYVRDIFEAEGWVTYEGHDGALCKACAERMKA